MVHIGSFPQENVERNIMMINKKKSIEALR